MADSVDVGPMMRLAVGHHQAGRFAEAEKIYREVLAIQPQHADAQHLLGLVAYSAGHREAALSHVRRAILVNNQVPDYHVHLGVILLSLDRIDEAIGALNNAVAMSPTNPAAYSNLALALSEKGMYREAMAAYRTAIELDAEQPIVRFNLGMIQLLTGDFTDGWENYESRTECAGGVAPRAFSRPRWDGAVLDGKRILIHAEQGFGDTLHFARYLPQVAARGGRVVLQCRPELVRLLRGQPCVEEISADAESPRFDLEIPLLSLPRIFGTRLESIPSQTPYLRADSAMGETWRQNLGPRTSSPRIGLVWAGSPTHAGDRRRSIPLKQFAPLGKAIDAAFFTLQKGAAGSQATEGSPELKLIDHTAALNDFADTAALIEQLDLVIAVDTAVAHLAGAMGKPVWVLLPFNPDWRWLLGREDSPWYPTMRLFRQNAIGDWAGVVRRVAESLAEFRRRSS